jgi:hypothetical protein
VHWFAQELARFGPTTPTRAGRLADASVDPTDARNLQLEETLTPRRARGLYS